MAFTPGDNNHAGYVNVSKERKQCDASFTQYLQDPEFHQDYIEHRRLVAEAERLSRRHQLDNGSQVKKASTYTDEDFRNMLMNVYGPLVTTSPDYVRLFEAYKSSKLEQLVQWEREEASSPQKTDYTALALCNLDLYEEDTDMMKDYFNGYIPINPTWRESLTNRTFFQIEENYMKLTMRENNNTYTLDPTRHRANKDWLMLGDLRPPEIRNLPFISSDPSQISSEEEKIAKAYGRTPFLNTLPGNSPNPQIRWPSLYFDCQCSFDLEKLIWHQIQVILSFRNGIVKVADLEDEYLNTFGYSIRLLLDPWTRTDPNLFVDMTSFVEKMQLRFNYGNIYLRRKTIDYNPTLDTYTTDLYLVRQMINNKYDAGIEIIIQDNIGTVAKDKVDNVRPSQISHHPGVVKNDPAEARRNKELGFGMQCYPITVIPGQFVQFGEEPLVISDSIVEDSYLRAIPYFMVSPSQIYVNLFQFCVHLEFFQREIQQRMKLLLEDTTTKHTVFAKISALYPGQLVMAFCKEAQEGGVLEWYRAKIESLTCVPKFKMIVQLIDYGTFASISDSLRICYMRRDMLIDFPQQAIECKLRFCGYRNDECPKWNSMANEELTELLRGKNIGVNFVERVYHENLEPGVWRNENVWLVCINILVKGSDGCHTKNQSETDVFNHLLQPSIGLELERRRKKKMKKTPTMSAQPQLDFECKMELVRQHGEFLCKVTTYNISTLLEKCIISTEQQI